MKLVLGTRNGHLTRWLVGVVAIGVGVMLSSACGSNAASGNTAPGNAAAASNTAPVQLNPASGPANSKPTWSTPDACPPGFQGSAVFSEAHADGTYTTIAPVVNGTNHPFSGTLLATLALIKSVGGIPDGATQELFVQCASGPGGTGNVTNYMKTFVTYSADGTSYTSSSTAP